MRNNNIGFIWPIIIGIVLFTMIVAAAAVMGAIVVLSLF
jgi:hypothetical protein